jgi:hypothetical protein
MTTTQATPWSEPCTGCPLTDGPGYDGPMVLARLEPWHWWIGVVFAVATIAAVVGLVFNYVDKVVRPTYPSRHQRPEI